MRRRHLFLFLALVALLSGTVYTGAFTSVSADRTVSVDVAGDTEAYLGLEPSDSPDSAYAQVKNGQLELVLDGSASGVTGQGLNPEAITRLTDVFNITNQGAKSVNVSIQHNNSQISFFASGNTSIDTADGAISLSPGETTQVDITLISNSSGKLESLSSITVCATSNRIDPGDGNNDNRGGKNNSTDRGSNESISMQIGGEELTSANTLVVDDPVEQEESLAKTYASSYTGVILSRVAYAPEDAKLHIRQSAGQPAYTPFPPTDQTVVTHYQVDPTEGVNNATLGFQLQDELVNAHEEIEILRYDGSWEQIPIKQINSTPNGSIVTVTTNGFSTYAVASDVSLQAEVGDGKYIEQISLYNTLDQDTDDSVENFDVNVKFDPTVLDQFENPHFSLWIDDTHLRTYPLSDRLDDTVRIPISWEKLQHMSSGPHELRVEIRRSQLLTSQHVDSRSISVDLDAAQWDDSKANRTIHEYQSELNQTYRCASTKFYNSNFWSEAAEERASETADMINSLVDSTFAPSPLELAIDVAGFFSTGVGAADTAHTAVKGAQIASGFAGVAQAESTAIYLDEIGSETRTLRTHFDQLADNTERLQQARKNNKSKIEQQLLEQRRELLRETYTYLPNYTEALHAAIVEKSVGDEDQQTYASLREWTERFRTHINTDYALTTQELTGSSASLARVAPMPTHGWQDNDHTEVYDAIEYPGDYGIHRVTVSESKAGENVHLQLESANANGFDVYITDEQPDDPAEATGEQFGETIKAGPSSDVRTHTIKSPGEYFVVVRGTQSLGYYRLIGSTGSGIFEPSDAISMKPLSRGHPVVSRPQLELQQTPPSFDVEEASDKTIYATENSTPALQWNAIDSETPREELEYRYRVDTGRGFSGLTDWQSVAADGNITLEPDLTEGVNRVQLVVRNNRYLQAIDSVDVLVTTVDPQTYLVTDGDPTEGTVYVKILPDRRIKAVEFEYREVGADTWTDWRTITRTTNLGRLAFPKTGTFEVRARAITPTDRTGSWGYTTLVHTGPPSIMLTEAPPEYNTGTATRRFTENETVNIAWTARSKYSAPEDLEYQTRANTGEWSTWQSVNSSGQIAASFTLKEGQHTVAVRVRDELQRKTTSRTSLTVSPSAPTASINGTSGVERIRTKVSLDQPARTLSIEYHSQEEWHQLAQRSNLPAGTSTVTAPINKTGVYTIRVRATDYLNNTGEYVVDQATVVPGTSEEINETYHGSTEDAEESYTIPEVDGSNNIGLRVVDGEVVLHAYLLMRQQRSEHLKSIELTERGNQTLTVDAPEALLEDAQGMELRLAGEGTVVLDTLRTFRETSPEFTITPDGNITSVGDPVRLSINNLGYTNDSIKTVNWDLTGDGTIDRTTDGLSTTTTFETSGENNLSVRVTDIFGTTHTITSTLYVNAPPIPKVTVPETAVIDEQIEFNSSASGDPDGRVVSYDWYIDGNRQLTKNATLGAQFSEPGGHTVRVTVQDNNGSTASTRKQVAVVGPMNFSRVNGFDCTGVCQVENETTLILGGNPLSEEIVLRQGKEEYRVSALSNGQPIGQFYDYGNAKINSPLPIAMSDHSRLFFWDGPEGLSLVTLHDKPNDGSGGAVSFEFENLPGAGSWVVKDDGNDFTSRSQVDWTWNKHKTDGGVFRGEELYNQNITIYPDFNNDARKNPLTPGQIDTWEVLTGQATNPRAFPLNKDVPVTIEFPTQASDSNIEKDGEVSTATWNYSINNRSSIPFDLVYKTEQTGQNPEVTVTIQGQSGEIQQKHLMIGTAGVERKQLQFDQFDSPVEISVTARDVDIRLRVVPAT